MEHEKIQEKIWTLDDPQLSSSDRREIEKHLENCGSCRDSVQRLNAIQKSLQATPAADGAFVHKVMENLREQDAEAAELKFAFRLPRWLVPLIGYGFAGLLMFIAIELRQPWSTATTQSVLISEVPNHAQWQFSQDTLSVDNLLPANGGN